MSESPSQSPAESQESRQSRLDAQLIAAISEPQFAETTALLKAKASLREADIPKLISLVIGYRHLEPLKTVLQAKATINETSIRKEAMQHLLSLATSQGELDLLKTLLQAKATVNDEENTLLMNAVHWPHIVTELLRAKAPVNTANKDGDTALHRAVRGGCLDSLNKLLEAKAAVNTLKNDHSPLRYAVSYSGSGADPQLVRWGMIAELLKARASTDKVVKDLLEAKSSIGKAELLNFALFYRVRTGNQEEVRRLLVELADKAQFNLTDAHGLTMLHWAVEKNYVAAAEELLKAKATANIRDEEGDTPLHSAAAEGNLEIIRILLQANASLEAPDKSRRSPLLRAAFRNQPEAVSALLVAKADIGPNEYKETALHLAAQGGCLDIINELLGKEAYGDAHDDQSQSSLPSVSSSSSIATTAPLWDINARDYKGFTPLHWAAMNGYTKTWMKLLQAKADIEIPDNEGRTVLHMAAEFGHVDVTAKLLAARATIEMRNKKGQTALHLAAEFGHVDVTEKLLEAKADIEARDHDQATPLFATTISGYLKVTTQLLAASAEINVVNKWSNSPAYAAMFAFTVESRESGFRSGGGGFVPIIKMLLKKAKEAGAKKSFRDTTALFWAVRNQNIDLVQTFIEAREMMEDMDQALFLATQKRPYDDYNYRSSAIAEILITAGAKAKSKNEQGQTALHRAIEDNWSSAILKKLITPAGAELDAIDKDGYSALHLAARKRNSVAVEVLLTARAIIKKADIAPLIELYRNEKDKYNETQVLIDRLTSPQNNSLREEFLAAQEQNNGHQRMWHLAAQQNGQALTRALLDAKAEVNAVDKQDGRTALHWAAENGDSVLVEQLLEAKASLDIHDKDFLSPLHYAAENGHDGAVKVLLRARATVDICDDGDFTPLHLAANEGHRAVTQSLIDAKANIAAKNKFSATALHCAVAEKHLKIAQILVAAAVKQTSLEVAKQPDDKSAIATNPGYALASLTHSRFPFSASPLYHNPLLSDQETPETYLSQPLFVK